MMRKLTLAVMLTFGIGALSGCVELAVGAAGAVIADEALEQRNGGDGLF